MKIVNKNVYVCEYCGKEFISSRGGKIHEVHYCKKNIKRLIKTDERLGIPLFG